MNDAREFCLVLITAGSEKEGAKIAKSLLARKLCACVNLIPKVRSIYRWQDAIEDETETLLIVKTRKDRLQDLSEHVAENHTYDVPEVISLSLEQGRTSYLEWLAGSCGDWPPAGAE